MRRAVTPVIPPSMFRHFAILTVALTTGLAMFAQGENREAQAAQMVKPAAAKPAKPAAFATPSTASSSTETPSWFNDGGEDFDSGFGSPMQRLTGGGGGIVPNLSHIVAPGYSPEYLASLSDAERELLLQGLQDNGMLDAQIRAEQTAALTAESRRRSGDATFGE